MPVFTPKHLFCLKNHLRCMFHSSFVYIQPLFAYNALIWKNTITILTLILFVVFLVRGLYLLQFWGNIF